MISNLTTSVQIYDDLLLQVPSTIWQKLRHHSYALDYISTMFCFLTFMK